MDLSLSFLKYHKLLFWIKYLTVELLKISFNRKVSYENIINIIQRIVIQLAYLLLELKYYHKI